MTCILVSLPEWSKGLRSGRNVFERVGSNPTADIFTHNSRRHRSRSWAVWRDGLCFLRGRVAMFCWRVHGTGESIQMVRWMHVTDVALGMIDMRQIGVSVGWMGCFWRGDA